MVVITVSLRSGGVEAKPGHMLVGTSMATGATRDYVVPAQRQARGGCIRGGLCWHDKRRSPDDMQIKKRTGV